MIRLGIEKPIIMIMVFVFVVFLIIQIIPVLADSSLVTSTDSANLTSYSAGLSEMWPLFGLLVTGGVIALAIETRR